MRVRRLYNSFSSKMSLEFVESERGHLKLCDKGFMYYFDRENGAKTHWKCQFVKKFRCPARVTTENGKITHYSEREHNHVGDVANVEKEKVSAAIRHAAKTTSDAPKIILASCLQIASQSAVATLPKLRYVKRNIRNQRRKVNRYPPLPQNRQDIDLATLTTTKKGAEFLLHDSGKEDTDRILVFGTANNIQILRSSTRWFVDGTFKTAPKLFYQMYTIHGLIGNETYPLVYALLPSKKKKTYIRLLRILKGLEVDLNPGYVTMDYEKAVIKAFAVSTNFL